MGYFQGTFFRGYFSRDIFSGTIFPGTIFLGTIFPRTFCPRTIFPGTFYPGTFFFHGSIFSETFYPGTFFSTGPFFLGLLIRGFFPAFPENSYPHSTVILRKYFENIPLKSCNIARIFIKLLERFLKYFKNLAKSVQNIINGMLLQY